MKHPNPLPASHFEKISDEPVKIKPYNPKFRKIAKEYLTRLNKMLKPANVKANHTGATALGISGKGDIEFTIHPENQEQWDKTLFTLINYFGKIRTLNYGFARFISIYRGYDIEVTVITGEYGKLDTKIIKFLKKRPRLIKEYEKIKEASAYSKKEYAKAKNNFFLKIVEKIPEDKK